MSFDIDEIKKLSLSMQGGGEEKKEEIPQEEPKAENAEDSSLKEEVKEEVQPKEESPEAQKEEESQPTAEEEPKKEEQPKEEVKAETLKTFTQEEVDNLLKERLEDAKLDWEDEYKQPEPDYVPSDYVKGIMEAEKKGHKVDDSQFWKFQLEDFAKTAEIGITNKEVGLDMIADSMQIDDPDAPVSELMEELKLRYRDMLSGDYESEDPEYKRAELAYNRDLRKSARALKTLQEELKLPQNPEVKQRIEQEEENKKIEAARPKAERQFKRRVDKFIENNKAYTYEHNGEKYEYELGKEDIAEFKKYFNIMFENNPNMVSADGLNEELIKEGSFKTRLNNLIWTNPKIRNTIIEKIGESKGAQKLEEDVKSRKNLDLPSGQGTKAEDKRSYSEAESLAEQIKSNPIFR